MSKQASPSSSPLALDTSEWQHSRLSMSVLRLHLDHFHLVHSGCKAEVMLCLCHHFQGLLTLSSDYSDDDGNGDNHNEPPSDAYEDLSESDEDGNNAPQQSLDGTLSSPLSTPDDSGSDHSPLCCPHFQAQEALVLSVSPPPRIEITSKNFNETN